MLKLAEANPRETTHWPNGSSSSGPWGRRRVSVLLNKARARGMPVEALREQALGSTERELEVPVLPI